jgi:AcrR family transcriptional regulator
MELAMADRALAPLLAQALAPDDAAEPSVEGSTDEKILDAALELVAAYGARRTSVDQIAARAGVARATVFRRFGSKDAIVERLFMRDVRRFLTLISEMTADAPDAATSVVEAFVAAVRAATSHPLIQRLARVEPHVLIEALRSGDPSPLELGRSFVAERIRAGQRRGVVVPELNAGEIADVLVRLALSYALMPGDVVDVEDEQALRAFAQSAIAPILAAPRASAGSR